MTKINPFMNVLFLLAAIILCIIPQCLAALSDKQKCYDPTCSEPISLARTTLAYMSNDREVMSFGINADVKVFSKGAGRRTDLWGVEINGKRGFAPKSFLNEYKVLQRKLSYEVPVYKFTDEVNKVQLNKLESIEKTDSLLKDELPNDKETLPSNIVESVDKSTTQESESINADIISPYEVIDGTTFYFDKLTVQPTFVSEVVHATALPNEPASVTTNSKIDPDHKEPSNKNTFIHNKELQSDTSDASNKLEEITLPVDIHKQTSAEILLEGSEAIINSSLDTASRDDTVMLDESNKSKDESFKNLEHKEKLDSTEEDSDDEVNINDSKEEEALESEGLFASFTKTFNILSNLEETVADESTIQGINDVTEATTKSYLQLQEQISEDFKIKDAVTEETIPTAQTELDSTIDSSLTNKEKLEMQQDIVREILYESIENAKISDEEIKKEIPAIPLENATSPSDVPSSNNFVHEDVDKPAKELPTTSSVLGDDNSASTKADVNSHDDNIPMQKTSKPEEVAKNIGTVVVSFEGDPTIPTSNLQEIVTTNSTVTQSSDDIKQKLLKEIKEDVDYKELTVQDEIAAAEKILETTNLASVKEAMENIKEPLYESHTVEENLAITNEALNHNAADIQFIEKLIVYNNVNNNNLVDDVNFDNVPIEPNKFFNNLGPEQSIEDSSQKSMTTEQTSTFDEVLQNQDVSNIENVERKNIENQIVSSVTEKETLPEYGDHISSEDKVLHKDEDIKEDNKLEKPESMPTLDEIEVTSDKVCSLHDHECTIDDIATNEFLEEKEEFENEEDNLVNAIKLDHIYWKTLMYLCVTAFTTLAFTLGYYYIENTRRDGQLIARINKLEKELLVSTKECEVFSENLKSTKEKLHCIEDESFGSNEMVVSLKGDLEMSQNAKVELEEQVVMLEKDLENATEAGLELERMLREVLSSNNEVNPLAQSVEDLQARLDAQQAANESLTNALSLKIQEIETLSANLVSVKKKYKDLETEFSQVQDELVTQKDLKDNVEQRLTDKIHSLEEQIDELSIEKSSLYKELKGKEIEVKEMMEVINQVKSNNLDLEKLYDVSRIKIEAVQLRDERDELKMRLSDVEGAHQLLEEHMKLVKEEITALSDQCKIAEKEKKDAETRLEVLSKFFKEKEAERQKEEAVWLQKQGEVVSTVERLHMMQNEIQNYKQQIEMLKREIMDQEREYKNQISALETKAHEQWVAARQNERRLEESKAEAGQLRNRLTLVEKNLNDVDPEAKLHRLEANGETVTSPALFIGAESSSSPVMFSGSSGVPPPPPHSYLHCLPPYLPPLLPPTVSGLPPYDISQRPPPLGGRLSSPPPMPPPPLHPAPASGGRYENAGSPPPPMSPPHLLPPFNRHRSPPPPPPFGSDHIPLPPPPGSILPPPLGTTHSWGEESLPPPRNSGFHPHQREQRARNHKGSLHSSGESLDKTHHGKV